MLNHKYVHYVVNCNYSVLMKVIDTNVTTKSVKLSWYFLIKFYSN